MGAATHLLIHAVCSTSADGNPLMPRPQAGRGRVRVNITVATAVAAPHRDPAGTVWRRVGDRDAHRLPLIAAADVPWPCPPDEREKESAWRLALHIRRASETAVDPSWPPHLPVPTSSDPRFRGQGRQVSVEGQRSPSRRRVTVTAVRRLLPVQAARWTDPVASAASASIPSSATWRAVTCSRGSCAHSAYGHPATGRPRTDPTPPRPASTPPADHPRPYGSPPRSSA